MYRMKKNNNNSLNSILWIIIAILCMNTIAILLLFIDSRKKYNNLAINFARLSSQLTEEVEPSVFDAGDIEYQYLGDVDAPVELLLIMDFECPYCKRMADQIFPLIIEDFVDSGLLKISYLPFPLSSHENALAAAAAAAYVNDNGEFWPFFFYMYENSDSLSPEVILSYASDNGFDSEAFKNAVTEPSLSGQITARRTELAEKGIKGTPSIVINGRLYPVFKDYQQLKASIMDELALSVDKITVSAAAELYDLKNAEFIDVRTAEEYGSGHIKGAVNLDVTEENVFRKSLNSLDKNKTYVIYCKSGKRSTKAAGIMAAECFVDIVNMTDGYDGWSSSAD